MCHNLCMEDLKYVYINFYIYNIETNEAYIQ